MKMANHQRNKPSGFDEQELCLPCFPVVSSWISVYWKNLRLGNRGAQLLLKTAVFRRGSAWKRPRFLPPSVPFRNGASHHPDYWSSAARAPSEKWCAVGKANTYQTFIQAAFQVFNVFWHLPHLATKRLGIELGRLWYVVMNRSSDHREVKLTDSSSSATRDVNAAIVTCNSWFSATSLAASPLGLSRVIFIFAIFFRLHWYQ